jgi:hypothetical protein
MLMRRKGDRIWSKEEEKYLIENYTKLGSKIISINLNRTCVGVKLKASKLGIKRDILGENNSQWKGDIVGYAQLHRWISQRKEKPLECPRCKKRTRWIDLSNISGEYKRDVNDFEWLCRTCHNIKDRDKKRKIKKMEEIFNGDARVLE